MSQKNFSCEDFGCDDHECCGRGKYKWIWPEVVGMNGEQAKAIIEKDNPLVSGEIVPPGQGVRADFCCNRVFVFVDKNGKVAYPPEAGYASVRINA